MDNNKYSNAQDPNYAEHKDITLHEFSDMETRTVKKVYANSTYIQRDPNNSSKKEYLISDGQIIIIFDDAKGIKIYKDSEEDTELYIDSITKKEAMLMGFYSEEEFNKDTEFFKEAMKFWSVDRDKKYKEKRAKEIANDKELLDLIQKELLNQKENV